MSLHYEYMCWLERWGGVLSVVMVLWSLVTAIVDYGQEWWLTVFELSGAIAWLGFLIFWWVDIISGRWKHRWIEGWLKKHGEPIP